MSTSDPSGRQSLRAALRRGRILLLWVFLFSVCVNVLMLTGPLYMLAVYDQVLTSGSVDLLSALTVLVFALFLLMGVLDYARGRIMARIGARVQSSLDAQVFEKILGRAADPIDRRSNANMLRHLESVQAMFLSPVLTAVMDMPWTPLFVVAIFLLHPMLGWLALAGGVLIVAIAVANQMITAQSVRSAQSKSQQADKFSQDALGNHEIVLGQGMIRNLVQRHVGLRETAQAQHMRASDWTGLFASGSRSFRLFLQSAILGLGAYFVLKGELTPGAMIAASILLGRALAPVEQALSNWPVLQRARLGWAALTHLFSLDQTQVTHVPLPRPTADLSVTDLSVTPPGGRLPTIRGLVFDLRPGQVLGVIGPSGSGKSSLARALVGAWTPSSGNILLAGHPLSHYDKTDLGNYIGYLPQSVHLFPGTIAENICRMAPNPDRTTVIDAAKRAGAHKMIMALPAGYDTLLEGTDSLLSGGQRQRVALARAVFGDPVLLVLDEPNSMLDSDGAYALNNTVKSFKAQGKSVILMTHRPQAISECDMLLAIKDGATTSFGQRSDVLEKTFPNIQKIRDLVARKASQ